MHYFNRINGVDIDVTADQFSPQLLNYAKQTKITNMGGRNGFFYEKSQRILQLKLGL